MQRKLRLRNRRDFSYIYRSGKSFANQQLILYWNRQLKAEPIRLGVSASKKIGNAVVRNRMRRKMKEIVRLHIDHIKPQLDLIIIVRKPAVTMSYQQLERSVQHLLKKAKLWQH